MLIHRRVRDMNLGWQVLLKWRMRMAFLYKLKPMMRWPISLCGMTSRWWLLPTEICTRSWTSSIRNHRGSTSRVADSRSASPSYHDHCGRYRHCPLRHFGNHSNARGHFPELEL